MAQAGGRPKGGVGVIQEIFGVNAHIRAVADDYAKQGYLAVAPALFDRVRPGIELGYEAADIAEGREIRGKLENDDALLDVAAAADAVKSAGRIAAVGYCWGGTLRSEEHTSELQSLMRSSYAVFCFTKKKSN